MWKERLKRIIILLVVAVLVFFGGKVFADWQAKKKISGGAVSLPTQQIGEKMTDLGEQVLGKAVEVIPGGSNLKEKLKTESSPTPATSQGVAELETTTQTEKVEVKTQEILEIIKELPAEQLEKIKKQIFKDFCQQVLEEQ